MPPPVPNGFINTAEARKKTTDAGNIIGVVVDVLERKRIIKTNSFCVTFTIKDDDFSAPSWEGGYKARYFSKTEHSIPDVRVGDVFLIRGIRFRRHNEQPLGVVQDVDSPPWVIFRQGDDPNAPVAMIGNAGAEEPSLQETTYAKALLNEFALTGTPSSGNVNPRKSDQMTAVQHSSSSQPSQPEQPGQDKFALIKNCSANQFVDLIVHVVKTFQESSVFQLYVTDYTSNDRLYDRLEPSDLEDGENEGTLGDEFGYLGRPSGRRRWRGPWGKMTLQVALWEPHGQWASQHVKENSYVYLKNVRIKETKISKQLEGAVHTDRIYPQKINIEIIKEDSKDSRFLALKKRKEEYWQRRKSNTDQQDGESSKSKKNAKKRRKEKQRKQQQQQQQQQAAKREADQPNIEVSIQNKSNRPNPNIRTIDPYRERRSIPAILNNESHVYPLPGGGSFRLPFQNLKYRTIARVVDFFPPNLEDFAVLVDPRDLADTSDEEMGDDDNDLAAQGNNLVWEWRFCLLLEDPNPPPPGQPREYMRCFVSGQDAEYFLKLDATDLRKNPQTLEQLRERLFILWGDLEERKRAAPDGQLDLTQPQNTPSQRPFTCCIKEYGVPCDCLEEGDGKESGHHEEGCLRWQRRFAMFGTTINI